MKFLISIFVLGNTLFCFGQIEMDSVRNAHIDSLLKYKIDTVILFEDITSGGVPLFKETHINNSTYSVVLDSSYILYFQKPNWTFVKYISFIETNADKVITLISKPFHLVEDSNLSNLRKIIPKINNEHFLPYITEHIKNGIKGYDFYSGTHYPTFVISVFTKKDSTSAVILEYTIEKEFPNIGSIRDDWKVASNINYEYNKSLNLYTVFKTIKQYIININSQLTY